MTVPPVGTTSTTVITTVTQGNYNLSNKPRGGDDVIPERGGGETLVGSSVPTLSMPMMSDAAAMMTALLALKVEGGNTAQKTSMEDIQSTGLAQKSKNAEVARKMAEAIEKMEEAAKSSLFAKIFGWIAVALTVVAAVLTGGALAAVAAGVAVTMAVLSETGVMDKITEAIAESLQKPPSSMDEETAQKWAMGIMIGISVAVSLVGIASSISSIVSSATTAATKIAAETTKNVIKAIIESINKAMPNLARVVQVSGSVASIGQQGANIDGAIHTRDAAEKTAESAELKKFLAKLQQQLDDEVDRLQQMMAQMTETFSKAMKIIGGLTQQQDFSIQQMA